MSQGFYDDLMVRTSDSDSTNELRITTLSSSAVGASDYSSLTIPTDLGHFNMSGVVPPPPTEGTLMLDTSTGRLKVYLNNEWLDFNHMKDAILPQKADVPEVDKSIMRRVFW